MLGRFVRVVGGVQHVPMREVRVVCRFFMIACGVVLRGFAMMLRGRFVMFGGLVMMIRNAVLVAHVVLTPRELGVDRAWRLDR